MALRPILPTDFITVLNALNDPDTVYVIPSFQRPYAWDKGHQVEDLLLDMNKASKTKGQHYLSALHLIPLNPESPDDRLAEFVDYEKNQDLNNLLNAAKSGGLVTQNDNTVKVYAVVDGQQRLTTLFLLAHIYYSGKADPARKNNLVVKLANGCELPRIIQNPKADHDFMMALVDQLWKQQPNFTYSSTMKSQAQKHMLENTQAMRQWSTQESIALQFLVSKDFKINLIELEPDHGLTSFMTLNDRGKPLTILEKLKSLLLLYAYDARTVDLNKSKSLITRLHNVFGDLYRILDECISSELFSEHNGDDEMVRLLSCYLRLDSDKLAIEQGAGAAYDEYFRAKLSEKSLADALTKIDYWCKEIAEVSKQLKMLNGYFSSPIIPALHFSRQNYSVSDDYKVVLHSLGLQPHLLALLLKFRALFGKEWHERFQIQVSKFPLQSIRDFLSEVRQKAIDANAAPQSLLIYIDGLKQVEPQPRQEISMLELVERMQMLDWNLGSRRLQGFVDWCRATFAGSVSGPAHFITNWASWRSPCDFIDQMLRQRSNETNLRYLLKEYERSFGVNLHFVCQNQISTGPIELEHVFAQQIDQEPGFKGFSYYGISDSAEFEEKVLWRSGNLTWLSKSANASLGNQAPDIKAADYMGCPGHPSGGGQNICSNINITKKIGVELRELVPDYPSMRFYIEARCAELGLFALERF